MSVIRDLIYPDLCSLIFSSTIYAHGEHKSLSSVKVSLIPQQYVAVSPVEDQNVTH